MSPKSDQVAKDQIAKDLTLVPKEKRLVIGKCNMRLDPKMKRPKEVTYQVVLDSLALATCYPAFTITADLPEVYMHQFWNTIHKHRSSYRFRLDDKKFAVNVEEFRRILNICPIVEGQEFDKVPYETDALEFVRSLGHSSEIKYITDITVDHLHQPWRTFATIINRCVSGKVYGLDKLRLSRIQIL